ncbi:MAG TPA: alpha-ketoacid dehydrogenase subunit beta [Thermodesulfobacteriota bacterium]|nr:alpha-ketoacid dehydrogenase subunit beta [Thermodesulfobacteriota bacterium]
MKEITYAEAITEALTEEMNRDERVFVMGEDVGRFGGIYVAIPKLWKEFGDERVRDTPISENAIIGFALGAAITGMRPVAELMFCDLTALAMDQIVNQAAKIRYMFGGNIKVPLVIRTTLGGLRSIAAQHSQSLEAWFTHVPGLKIAMPSTPYTAKGLLKTAIRDDNPVMLFEHQQLMRTKGVVPEEEYLVPFGQAEIMREGKDLTVVATSLMVHRALNAARELEKYGIQIEVIDPCTLNPFDKKTILASVQKTGRLLVVHQGCRTSGFGAEVAAITAEEGFEYLISPVRRVASLDVPVPYSKKLENFVIPDEQRIVKEVMSMLEA